MPQSPIQRLLEIMARLRDPDTGCPWDVQQDFRSIAPYTIEEAHEVAEAIERGGAEELKLELGDLLFQVVFHARMAEEAGWFDFDDVAAGICEKMVRRHPHVFADAARPNASGQTRAWEAHKAEERKARGDHGRLDGVAHGLPPTRRAWKLQKRAAEVGFDWPDAAPVLGKLDEELDEIRGALGANDSGAVEDELGDLMFVLVNLARKLGHDPDAALRRANLKFENRFRAMEALAAARGQALEGLSLEEQEALWQQVKAEET